MSMFERIGKLEKGKYQVDLGVKEGNPGRTKQNHKNECDINAIVAKARRQGMINANIIRTPMYADVSNVPDLGEALMIIKNAQEQFEQLDPKIRRRFGNDPSRLMEYLKDPNLDVEEAVKLGLINPPKKEEVPPVETPKEEEVK